jgi:hypothetical protein
MARRRTKPAGQLRQSQVVTTFGPGAMLDLPENSVLIGGLDHWTGRGPEIEEIRLVEKLKALLELPSLKLFAPPPTQDDDSLPQTNLTAWRFPEWFITQEIAGGPARSAGMRSRMLVSGKALHRGVFFDNDRVKRRVVPVRFVRACRGGHIGDIDWRRFVHGGASTCMRQLWMDERGTSGDLSEVFVRCECKMEVSMLQATIVANKTLGQCDGRMPWLGPASQEPCGEPNRLLIRTASNAYFPQLISVISLPDRSDAVKEAVGGAWDFLEAADSADDVRHERKKAKVRELLEGITDDEVFAEIQRRRTGFAGEIKSVKQAELETLTASKDDVGGDQPDGAFHARSLPRQKWDRPWMEKIERVVLVQRLREVVAQVGFTRFEVATPDLQGELEMGVRRAPLAREVSWLPATENRGEGIFLQFRKDAIEKWLEEPAVKARGRQLRAGFDCWKAEHQGSHRDFFGLPYVLLHSFAHLLITSMSLECGYASSSIRERIYALPSIGYGVLLYTGSSDAEGTLGGLIEAGRHIADHVRAALEFGELCSNDPVCAQHQPQNGHERRFLQGSACHGCVLIAETSCEQHNDYLDRALATRTVENLGVEFFRWPST